MFGNLSMDSEQDTPLSISNFQCCDCECACLTMNAWLRKFQEFEVEKSGFEIPGLDVPKVELLNECVMLREMVTSQQQRIDNFSVELEEERNASASSASEAMSMILRLQREKAEVQMEFRQYKRVVEEKIVHDGEEILALEDLLYKREQVIESLIREMETYKHRMMSYGLTEVEAEGEIDVVSQNNGNDYWEAKHEIPTYDCSSTECNSYENQFSYEVNNDVVEVEKHVFGEPPQSRGQFEDLKYRIKQSEESSKQSQPSVELFGTKNVLEKVIVSHSPTYRHVRRSSNDSLNSIYAETTDVAYDLGSTKKKEYVQVHLEENSNMKKADTALGVGDDMSDRVHTVEDIKKLYMRLQALEADRESMRQALISIGTEKAQLVLLKKIAQQLCQDLSLAKILPVRKTSVNGSFSIFSFFKWIVSFVFWRRKARQCSYMFGMSAHNTGMLALLDKGTRIRRWRSISSTKV